ncbi:MAG: CIA30 family protein [Pseudomonadota bacterium]
MTDATLSADCSLKIDFFDPAMVEPWRIVNDGVMGGLSQGTRFHEDRQMVFTGNINTNGGGFSSLRARIAPRPLAGTTGFNLKVRSEGRPYRMTFRTSERWRGRSVSYQAPIPRSNETEWTEVRVSFEDMETSVFGRSVRAAPFDPSDVREIGIILADGRDGPFRLEIAQMDCV